MITLVGESVKHIQNADICKKLKTLHSLRSSMAGGGGGGVDSCSPKLFRVVHPISVKSAAHVEPEKGPESPPDNPLLLTKLE